MVYEALLSFMIKYKNECIKSSIVNSVQMCNQMTAHLLGHAAYLLLHPLED